MGALTCTALPALAEVPARSDLFLGPSFIHTDFYRGTRGERNPFGGAVAWTDHQTPSFGIVLDGSLHYRSREGPDLRASLRELNLAVGPRFAFSRNRSASFFVQALFGLRNDRAKVSFLDISSSNSRTRFGMAFGGGVDVRVSRRWALRLQSDYLFSRLPEQTENGFLILRARNVDGFRVSAGAVYRFGSESPKQP